MILFHPDPEPTAGDPPPEPKPDASAELAALKAELSETKEAAARAESAKQAIQTLFNPNASEESRQVALSQVMMEGGLSQGDVQSLMAEMAQEGVAPEMPEIPEPVAEGVTPPSEEQERIAALESQLQEMQTGRAEAAKAQSKRALESAVATAWENSPDAKQITDRLTSIQGEEVSKKTAAMLQKDILRETLEGLYNRKAQVGTFNPEWIPEEVGKAASATLEKAKVLGVSDQVGKAPGGMDEAVLLSEIASREIKPPAYDADKSGAENTEAAEVYTVQRLQQVAAQHAAKEVGGESKA
jgi:hypothetical protein